MKKCVEKSSKTGIVTGKASGIAGFLPTRSKIQIMEQNFEYHLWTELLAFEQTDPDRGAARYLDPMPVKPDSVFLFICTADFLFGYRGMATEYELSPAVCSRNAHPRNERRERQKWTNKQLRELIANLKKRGVATYLSMSPGYHNDRFGPEWLSGHRELLNHVFDDIYRLEPIAFLNDGTPCEKIFGPKMAEVCRDYGFAGFHGLDCYGSTGLLYRKIATDDITGFFLRRTGLEAPDFVTRSCDCDPAKQKKRMSWIWGEHRREFTRFIQDRWTEFWKEVASHVHAVGGQCIMNSAFTRGSLEEAGWLGIDYKAVVEAGVDAIVCETVPLSQANQSPLATWQAIPDLHRHFHASFIAGMQEVRANLPDTKIMFLHGCKDVVEDWDNIRQSPACYERELFALASLCHYRKGKLHRAADGLTACLADGFSASDWEFVTARWKSAVRSDELVRAGDMVFVWDDKMVSDGVEDYFFDYFPTAYDTLYKFKYEGFAIQSTARSDELAAIHEPLLVPIAHLLGREAVAKLIDRPEPVVLIGRQDFLEEFASKGLAFKDSRIMVLILNSGAAPAEKTYMPQPDLPRMIEGGRNFLEIHSVVAVMPRMGFDPQLWQDVFAAIRSTLAGWNKRAGRFVPEVVDPTGECQLLTREFAGGRLETIVENLVIRNLPVKLRYSKPFRDCRITSSYPFYPRNLTENSMTIRTTANRGMCAVEVTAKENHS